MDGGFLRHGFLLWLATLLLGGTTSNILGNRISRSLSLYSTLPSECQSSTGPSAGAAPGTANVESPPEALCLGARLGEIARKESKPH